MTGFSLIVLDNLSTLCRGGVENEAESWSVVQDWMLSLRRRGISVLFVHHAGKGGTQRGTSRREDVMDSILRLQHPNDYAAADGARFEVHYEKARGVAPGEAVTFEARLETVDGATVWSLKDLDDRTTEQVAELHNEGGLSQRELAKELGISKSAANRHMKKAREQGLLDE